MLYYIRDEEGSLIGFKYNDMMYYYIKNMQEDIIGLTDENFNEIVRYAYDPWGKIISIKDNNNNEITDTSHIGIINPFRYRSYYYDNETKLYYLNSRYYNPEWGRFLNCDIGIMPTEIDGLNLYTYAKNNPINYEDNDGNLPKWLTKAVKKVIIGAAVIGACAIVTAVTGGIGAGVAGYIAAGTLKGAIVGAASGTVIGAGVGAVSSRIKNGNWKNSGKDAIAGAATGFAVGWATSVSKAKKATNNWSKGSMNSSYDSMTYHYNKHGNEIPNNNIVNYTNDALNFADRNKDVLQYTNPSWSNTMNPGFTAPYSQGHPNGWFTNDGNILTFWYTKMK